MSSVPQDVNSVSVPSGTPSVPGPRYCRNQPAKQPVEPLPGVPGTTPLVSQSFPPPVLPEKLTQSSSKAVQSLKWYHNCDPVPGPAVHGSSGPPGSVWQWVSNSGMSTNVPGGAFSSGAGGTA